MLNNDSSVQFKVQVRFKSKMTRHSKDVILSLEPIETQLPKVVTVSYKPTDRCMGDCCLKSLTVDFKTLGWHWIIHPQRYTANYCEGSCSLKTMSSMERAMLPSQSILRQEMLSKLNSEDTGTACIPASKQPLNMLYEGRDGVIRVGQLQTITSCKCV